MVRSFTGVVGVDSKGFMVKISPEQNPWAPVARLGDEMKRANGLHCDDQVVVMADHYHGPFYDFYVTFVTEVVPQNAVPPEAKL